jgi:hypothetical protein
MGTPAAADLTAIASKLLAYCRARDWAGHDPYDALNSRLFAACPALNTTPVRLVFTQILKRSPINVRPLLGIDRTQNAKALALFLSASLRLARHGIADADTADGMVGRLAGLRSSERDYWCWGYSFPWQTRTMVVPAGAPNLVCTTFVANALLDAYEQRGDTGALAMAVDAAQYIVDKLYWTDGPAVASFSYPLPSHRVQIYNANFLAAALLCRVSTLTGETALLAPALAAARCAATAQRDDGSWAYGNGPGQAWIDNFHTGYNLCAVADIRRYARTAEFDRCLRRGLAFYRSHFFTADGAARYFHDRTYPVDSHAVAQSLITLQTLSDLDPGAAPLARHVFRWAVAHLWDDRGFFYYRALRFCTIRTSYMRWSQAWMLLATATLLDGTAAAPALAEAC